jgi:hypothetical protein
VNRLHRSMQRAIVVTTLFYGLLLSDLHTLPTHVFASVPGERFELTGLFEGLQLPAEIGLDFPLPGTDDLRYPPIHDETARKWFFQDFHGSPMYAVGSFELYGFTVYVTYYVDTTTVGLDARYELFIYGDSPRSLGYMVLARQESRPGWIDGRNAGIERTLSAEMDWMQGEVHITQWNLQSISFFDECGEDGCPDPTTTMTTTTAILRMDGSIDTAVR